MDEQTRAAVAARLHTALRDRTPLPPVTQDFPELTVDDAYAIQRLGISMRCEAGARIVGMKIGLTSKPIQQALGVDRPDFGHLLSSMHVPNGGTADLDTLIAPRAEGEIAFVLAADLPEGPCTEADVLRATDFVTPTIEIIDSRIADWKITLADTIADNASSGLFVLGGKKTPIEGLDLRTVGMNVELNGELITTGAGAASLGDPVRSVAWLASTLAEYGMRLRAGDIVLSGGLAAAAPVKHGDWMRIELLTLGSVSVRFARGGVPA
jgi:2-oxopent-4-enoate/cis-2-oxohex-4-enoate hydratase